MKKFALGILVLSLTACYPPLVVMQDASIPEKGSVTATPYASASTSLDSDRRESLEGPLEQREFGAQVLVGVADGVAVQAAVSAIDTEVTEVILSLELGAKVSLIEDKLAVYVPLRFGFGDNTLMSVEPTLIGSIELTPTVRLNPFFRALVGTFVVASESDTQSELNIVPGLGANLHIDLAPNITIIPELGLVPVTSDWLQDGPSAWALNTNLGLRLSF